MRVNFVLIASAFCLLASSSAVSAEETFVNSLSAVQATGTRQLRGVAVGSDEGSLGSASVDEERGILDGVSEKAASAFAKLMVRVEKADDQLATLNTLITEYESVTKATFKQMKDANITPRYISKTLGIREKINTMTRKELLDDAGYMMWLYYWRYYHHKLFPASARWSP